jgi:hypothetical protein
VARQNPWLQLEGNMNACKRSLLRWQRKVLGRPNRVVGEKQMLLAILQGEEGTTRNKLFSVDKKSTLILQKSTLILLASTFGR